MESEDFKEAYKNAVLVTESQLEGLKESPLWTIVCVKQLCNQPYILAGRDDTPTKDRVWVAFSSQSKDELLKYFDWMQEGKKLYSEKARTPSEMDGLRQVLLAVGIIGDHMNDPDFTQNLYQSVIVRTAMKWFIADHPDQVDDAEKIIKNKKFSPYLDLVARYTTRLATYITSIRESIGEANKSAPPQ